MSHMATEKVLYPVTTVYGETIAQSSPGRCVRKKRLVLLCWVLQHVEQVYPAVYRRVVLEAGPIQLL